MTVSAAFSKSHYLLQLLFPLKAPIVVYFVSSWRSCHWKILDQHFRWKNFLRVEGVGFRPSFSNIRLYVTWLPASKGYKPGQFSTFIQSNQSIIGHPTLDSCLLSIESVINSLYRKSVERGIPNFSDKCLLHLGLQQLQPFSYSHHPIP